MQKTKQIMATLTLPIGIARVHTLFPIMMVGIGPSTKTPITQDASKAAPHALLASICWKCLQSRPRPEKKTRLDGVQKTEGCLAKRQKDYKKFDDRRN